MALDYSTCMFVSGSDVNCVMVGKTIHGFMLEFYHFHAWSNRIVSAKFASSRDGPVKGIQTRQG